MTETDTRTSAQNRTAAASMTNAETIAISDRGAYWARLRQRGRVVELPSGGTLPAGLYIPRRDDVVAALRAPDVFSRRRAPLNVMTADGRPIEQIPGNLAPARHAHLARALHAIYAPRSVAPFGDALRAHARALIGAVVPTGRCELVGDDIVPLYAHGAVWVTYGLAVEDCPAKLAVFRSEIDGKANFSELLQFIVTRLALVYGRSPGVLRDVMDGIDTPDGLTLNEFFGLILNLEFVGCNSLTDKLVLVLLRLAGDAGLRRRIRENPDLAPQFVEEVVRIDSGFSVGRTTTREVTIGGCTLPPGTRVNLCTESANREDGGVDFSIDRKPRRHWGFGGGVHRCLASHLARLALTTWVQEWLRQVPDFEVEHGFAPTFVTDYAARLTALPVRWDAK